MHNAQCTMLNAQCSMHNARGGTETRHFVSYARDVDAASVHLALSIVHCALQ